MASVTRAPKPPLGISLLMFAVILVVGFLAAQWVVGLVLALVRLVLILIGFYLIARVGLYLARKGR